MSKRWMVVLGLSLGLWSVGCSDDKKSKTPGNDAGDTPDAAPADAGKDAGPTSGKAIVKGRVADPDGRTVGNIEVQIGEKKVRTDNRGLFEAEDLPPGKTQVAVKDNEHSAAQVTVDVKDMEANQVSLTVLEYKKVELADAEAGGTVMSAEGMKVVLPPKSLKDKEGGMVKGKVEARYAIVNESGKLPASPGGMQAEMEKQVVDLESFGMIDIGFFQNDEKLTLDGEADLEFPLGINNKIDGEEVDIWSFDAESGKWKQEGKGTVDKSAGGNGVAKTKVKHFSWWNADAPLTDQTCIKGTLLTSTGSPIPNMQLQVTGVDYLTSLAASTGADGTFCSPVKLGSTNRVTAFGADGVSYFEWTSPDVVAGTTPAMCGATPDTCLDIGTVMGESLFDECKGNVSTDQNHVLILSSSNAALDAQAKALLESYGNTATVGPQYIAFDGTLDLSEYDAVYLQANVNWSAGDMPLPGQRQLINFVNCGGGLITVEWTVWKIGSNSFKLLDAVYPTVPTTTFGSDAMSTYVQVESDATVSNGLPTEFTFMADSFAGTEIDLNARSGATTFYDSTTRLAGVVGWDFNLGRVMSISTTGGPLELADPNWSRMFANSIDWLQRDTPNEPSKP